MAGSGVGVSKTCENTRAIDGSGGLSATVISPALGERIPAEPAARRTGDAYAHSTIKPAALRSLCRICPIAGEGDVELTNMLTSGHYVSRLRSCSVAEKSMTNTREVTIKSDGKQYGATYFVANGMLHINTHTESRSVEIGQQEPEALARSVLTEIVNAQPNG
jgi:hypothetical protein